MDHITKPSITRLSRQAGVKSMSDNCYNVIREIIVEELNNVLDMALIVNSEHNTKTMMSNDIYEALRLYGYNVAYSQCMGTTTCTK